MLNLKIASDVDVLVTKDGQTMAEMKTAHRSVFVRADLRAHLFGFILTSPDKHACSCLDRIHPVLPFGIRSALLFEGIETSLLLSDEP